MNIELVNVKDTVLFNTINHFRLMSVVASRYKMLSSIQREDIVQSELTRFLIVYSFGLSMLLKGYSALQIHEVLLW